MADALSWITTWLGPETVQAILDGATLGASQRVEGEDPAMIEGDQEKEKEAWVAAGWVLVEMHVTNWATAQKEDPELDAVLWWLEAKKKTDLRTLLGKHISSEKESSKFYDPPRHPLPALHTKRKEWGSVNIHGAKSTLDCHFK